MDMRLTEKSILWAKISPWVVKKGAYWANPALKQGAPEEIIDLFEPFSAKNTGVPPGTPVFLIGFRTKKAP